MMLNIIRSMMEKDTQNSYLHCVMPPELKKQLKAKAAMEGKTMTDAVLELIQKYVEPLKAAA